jgi:hypothetical protein
MIEKIGERKNPREAKITFEGLVTEALLTRF